MVRLGVDVETVAVVRPESRGESELDVPGVREHGDDIGQGQGPLAERLLAEALERGCWSVLLRVLVAAAAAAAPRRRAWPTDGADSGAKQTKAAAAARAPTFGCSSRWRRRR